MVLKIIFIFFVISIPSLASIDFVRDIKVSTSIWMKKSNLFPAFRGWGSFISF